jgi:hypothetical protein
METSGTCAFHITPLLFLPTDNFFELRHELALAQEVGCLADQSSKVHNVLGKQIQEFKKLVIGLTIVKELLHALEERCVIYSLGDVMWSWYV